MKIVIGILKYSFALFRFLKTQVCLIDEGSFFPTLTVTWSKVYNTHYITKCKVVNIAMCLG